MDEVMEQQEEETEGLGETAPGRRCWAGGRGKVTRATWQGVVTGRGWAPGRLLPAVADLEIRLSRPLRAAGGVFTNHSIQGGSASLGQANMAEHLRASVWGRQRNRLLVAGGRPSVWQVCPGALPLAPA